MDHPCLGCGEPLAPTARWCGLCHRRVLDVDPAELAMELRETVRSRWIRPHRFSAVSPPPRFSRTRGGPLSFGPMIKGLMTAGVVAIVALFTAMVSFADLYRDVFLVPMLILAGWLLRQIWRRERVE